jgi:predicted transcriptional regulator
MDRSDLGAHFGQRLVAVLAECPLKSQADYSRRVCVDSQQVDEGVSQSHLGAAVGISQSQMSKYLRGERVLDVDQLDALCFALHLDITEVVRDAANKAQRL